MDYNFSIKAFLVTCWQAERLKLSFLLPNEKENAKSN